MSIPQTPIVKKAIPKPVQKFNFDVKFEIIVPVEIVFREFAETPEEAQQQALLKLQQGRISYPKIYWNRLKTIAWTVYNAASSILRLKGKV